MRFIGKITEFNNKLQSLITIHDYTIVSHIGSDFIDVPNVDNLVQVFGIDDIKSYHDSLKMGTIKMAENYITTTNSCTNIYVYMHQYVDPSDIAEIINTFDKKNLVDNIFVYPKVPTLQLRNNEIEQLPWQQKNELSH